jgi:Beta-propeller repeat
MIKKILLLFFCINSVYSQSTIIMPGNNTSNILTNSSNNGGLELPKLTNIQIQGIQLPKIGTLVYDLDNNLLKFYNGNRWVATNEPNFYQQIGGSAYDYGKNIAFDNLGNLYVLGTFSLSINISGTLLNSTGFISDIFIAKYNTLGQLLWAVKGGGSNDDFAESIAIDNAGKIIVTGIFYNSTTFGFDTFSSSGSADIFVVKYNSDGTVVWGKGFGGTDDDRVNYISVDNSNNIYFTGFFWGTMNFQSVTSITSSGNNDIFYAKLDANGNVAWAKRFGGTLYDYANSLIADASGNVYLTGSYVGSVAQGTITLTGAGSNSHFFIAKAGSDGNLLWAKKGDGAVSFATGRDVLFDNSGNITVMGDFTGSTTFDSFVLSGSGSGGSEVFFAKYNNSGVIQSLSKFGSNNTAFPKSMTKDESGNFFITGFYSGTFQVGSRSFVSASSNIFVIKLNSNGIPLELQCGGVATPNDIAVKKDGSVYITGEFSENFSFNSFNFSSNGLTDCFLIKVF